MLLRPSLKGLVNLGILLAIMPVLSRGEIINFDELTPAAEVPRPYRGLIFAGVGYNNSFEGIQNSVTSSFPGVHNGTISRSNVLVTSNQGTSIQSPSINGDYPRTFTLRSAYFTAATTEHLTVTVVGTRWGRNTVTKTFVVSMQGPTFVSFNWPGIDEIQINGSGGTLDSLYRTAIVLDDLDLDMDGPFSFTSVRPCRLVDTRNSGGPFGAPQMSEGTVRDFLVPDKSDCEIPRNASAYALNVTVVPDGPLGFLTIWPAGQDRPIVSALNSDGRVKAASIIVPAGVNGGVSVFVTNSTHLILDITGYFSTGQGLSFYPLTPCRVSDTRNGAGDLGGPRLAGGAPGRSLPILLSTCGIPPSAQAYALNFTAVPQAKLGYLSVWPTGEVQPVVSTLNASTGSITANGAIVPAGEAGNISVYASDTTDLVIDVSGYFAPAGTGGLSLYTMTPCRALDTRDSSGPFSDKLDISFNTNCIIPRAARAYSLTATVVPSTGLEYLTLWANGEPQPTASTLNALDGAITSNMAIVPSSNSFIDAYATNSTHLILDIASYFAP